MGQIPYLKQLAMAGTVLATIFAAAAGVHGTARGAMTTGSLLRGMLTEPVSTMAPSTMAVTSIWHITWVNYLAIGWLIYGVIGITSNRTVAPRRCSYQNQSIAQVQRHEIRSIEQTVLHAQTPPPCLGI